MTKNLVVCCDGTGNQIEANLSNVLKLFRILHKNQNQRVYYNPGIGTIGTNDPWTILIRTQKACSNSQRVMVWTKKDSTPTDF